MNNVNVENKTVLAYAEVRRIASAFTAEREAT
jgi:hypothetical protein